MVQLARLTISAAALLPVILGEELPSCEADIAAHCLGEEDDLSPSGIESCVQALGSEQRSPLCAAYLSMMEGCAEEIGAGGVCEVDFKNGDAVPCLMQRTKPELLGDKCSAALPQKEEADQLGLRETFWADGKRFLEDDEVSQLNDEDRDTYKRWASRKSKKSGRNKDREFAIKQKKMAKATQLITFQASGAATKALEAGKSEKEATKAAAKVAKKEAKRMAKEDKELGKFKKADILAIAKAAVKAAKSELAELKKRKEL